MGEPLLCPACVDGENPGTLKWKTDGDDPDLDKSVLACKGCGAEYVGFPGLDEAWYEKNMAENERFRVWVKAAPKPGTIAKFKHEGKIYEGFVFESMAYRTFIECKELDTILALPIEDIIL